MKRQRTIVIRSMRIQQLTIDSRSFPKLTPSCFKKEDLEQRSETLC